MEIFYTITPFTSTDLWFNISSEIADYILSKSSHNEAVTYCSFSESPSLQNKVYKSALNLSNNQT